MRSEDFQLLCTLLKQRSGLVLSSDKVYLIESRLMPVARKYGYKGIDQLVDQIRIRREEALLADITEAMTTNESLFFRDIKPFENFRDKVLPKLMLQRPRKQVRIWSAACSSGQEPYSLSMILKEQAVRLAGWRFDIVATDLSNEILEKAKAGQYTQFEVQRGLPVNMMVKYFKQIGDKWQVDAAIRTMVTFREFNLLDDPRSLGRFDVVFCRNVLIYFDQATKTRVLEGISRLLPPDGVLYLGGAETVLGVSDRFQPIPGLRGIYCLTESAENMRRLAG